MIKYILIFCLINLKVEYGFCQNLLKRQYSIYNSLKVYPNGGIIGTYIYLNKDSTFLISLCKKQKIYAGEGTYSLNNSIIDLKFKTPTFIFDSVSIIRVGDYKDTVSINFLAYHSLNLEKGKSIYFTYNYVDDDLESNDFNTKKIYCDTSLNQVWKIPFQSNLYFKEIFNFNDKKKFIIQNSGNYNVTLFASDINIIYDYYYTSSDKLYFKILTQTPDYLKVKEINSKKIYYFRQCGIRLWLFIISAY